MAADAEQDHCDSSMLGGEEEFTYSYDAQDRIIEKKSNMGYNLHYNYK